MSSLDDRLPRGTGTAGAEVVALPAASVIVLRDAPLEVLMILRHEQSSFVPGAWVFPGGAVDRSDEEMSRHLSDELLTTMKIAALRELFEETGIWLGTPLNDPEQTRRGLLDGTLSLRNLASEAAPALARLVWTSHWITPLGLPKRFDTYFFLAGVGRDAVATVEHAEAVEAIWISPADALSRNATGELPMVFPTIRNLEAIRGYSTIQDALAARAGVTIKPMLPRVVIDGRKRTIVVDE
ncbi:MAG TPA: NUDIX hydrolase [Thermoanaerobaculia bacterium]|nr:NUDIX hydrolase [Thermoanaerobaculia bacterium]